MKSVSFFPFRKILLSLYLISPEIINILLFYQFNTAIRNQITLQIFFVLFIIVFETISAICLFFTKKKHLKLIYSFVLILIKACLIFYFGLPVKVLYSFIMANIIPLTFLLSYIGMIYFTKQSISQSLLPLNQLFFLLTSFFILYHFFYIYRILTFSASYNFSLVLFEIYLLLSLIPFFHLVRRIQKEATQSLHIENKDIHFRGNNISHFFSKSQKTIFNFFLQKLPNGVTCEELAPALDLSCKDTENCKPSICSEYLKIYRHILSLEKVLTELEIGKLISPENKQHIRRSGWILKLFDNIKIKKPALKSINQNKINSSFTKADTYTKNKIEKKTKLSELFHIIIVILMTTISFQIDLNSINNYQFNLLLLISAFLFIVFLTFPLFVNKKNFPYFFVINLILSQFMMFWLGRNSEAQLLIILFIKILIAFISILTYQFYHFNGSLPYPISRKNLNLSIIWILWFFLSANLIFRNHPIISFYEIEFQNSSFIPLLADWILFLSIFSINFRFLKKRQDNFKIRNKKLYRNNKSIFIKCSEENLLILSHFTKSQTANLTCQQIVKILYENESSQCKRDCKTSECPAYQRIYKRIRDIRKTLEILEAGTIISPIKTIDAKTTGWTFKLYSNVNFE